MQFNMRKYFLLPCLDVVSLISHDRTMDVMAWREEDWIVEPTLGDIYCLHKSDEQVNSDKSCEVRHVAEGSLITS